MPASFCISDAQYLQIKYAAKEEKYHTKRYVFWGLEDKSSQKHPMYISANNINWQPIEGAFPPLYRLDNGRPPKPTGKKKRLQAGWRVGWNAIYCTTRDTDRILTFSSAFQVGKRAAI